MPTVSERDRSASLPVTSVIVRSHNGQLRLQRVVRGSCESNQRASRQLRRGARGGRAVCGLSSRVGAIARSGREIGSGEAGCRERGETIVSQPRESVGVAMRAGPKMFLIALAIVGCGGGVDQVNSANGAATFQTKCKASISGCMEDAREQCHGDFRTIATEQHAGGIFADALPGPVTWHTLRFACGAPEDYHAEVEEVIASSVAQIYWPVCEVPPRPGKACGLLANKFTPEWVASYTNHICHEDSDQPSDRCVTRIITEFHDDLAARYTSRTVSTSRTHARAPQNNAARRGVSSSSLSRRMTTSSSNVRSNASTRSSGVHLRTDRRATLHAKKWRKRMRAGNKRELLSPWPALGSKDLRTVGTHRSPERRARGNTTCPQHNRHRPPLSARRTDAPATTLAVQVSRASKISLKRRAPAQRRSMRTACRRSHPRIRRASGSAIRINAASTPIAARASDAPRDRGFAERV